MTIKNSIRIIFATILTIAWFISVWYWFVCYINDYCLFADDAIVTQEIVEENENENDQLTIDEQAEALYQEVIANEENDEVTLEGEDSLINTSVEVKDDSEIPKLGNVTKDSFANCEELITSPIALGGRNNSDDVEKLQQFLNAYEGENLEVDGVYKSADNNAVKKFQEKYRSDILTPSGLNNPTGFVYKSTIKKINELYCAL